MSGVERARAVAVTHTGIGWQLIQRDTLQFRQQETCFAVGESNQEALAVVLARKRALGDFLFLFLRRVFAGNEC